MTLGVRNDGKNKCGGVTPFASVVVDVPSVDIVDHDELTKPVGAQRKTGQRGENHTRLPDSRVGPMCAHEATQPSFAWWHSRQSAEHRVKQRSSIMLGFVCFNSLFDGSAIPQKLRLVIHDANTRIATIAKATASAAQWP